MRLEGSFNLTHLSYFDAGLGWFGLYRLLWDEPKTAERFRSPRGEEYKVVNVDKAKYTYQVEPVHMTITISN